VIRIAHLSDFHYDRSRELQASLARMVDLAAAAEPSLVVVSGDLSASGQPDELDDVARALERLDPIPRVVLPGNRDLERSSGPPGDAQPPPLDSDLEFFLALEPALALGLDERGGGDGTDPGARFTERFGSLEPTFTNHEVAVVTVNSTPKVATASLERAAKRLRAAKGRIRIFALHHGVLPVPGRKVRQGDIVSRSGDLLALLTDLGVDLVLHGHLHRANVWGLSDGRRPLVVASAGALVNDGRRDASTLEILLDDGGVEIQRRSVASGRASVLYADGRRLPDAASA
jgi:3',5'-cyclic AMP phosphodiesterase CpdA